MTDFSKVIGFGSASQHIKFVKEGHRRGSPHFCVHWFFFLFLGVIGTSEVSSVYN